MVPVKGRALNSFRVVSPQGLTPKTLINEAVARRPHNKKPRNCWNAVHNLIFYPHINHTLGKGGLAQLVERLLCKQNVNGSNPLTSTTRDWILEIGN